MVNYTFVHVQVHWKYVSCFYASCCSHSSAILAGNMNNMILPTAPRILGSGHYIFCIFYLGPLTTDVAGTFPQTTPSHYYYY